MQAVPAAGLRLRPERSSAVGAVMHANTRPLLHDLAVRRATTSIER
jgi:hypothetical protein